MSSAGATLQGSYSSATGTISETGFYYGITPDDLGKVASGSTSSSFSKSLTNLKSFTTYYYKAYVVEAGQEVAGDVCTFATSAPSDWLEIPATDGDEDYVGTIFRSSGPRNYAFCYSYTRYAPLWTAFTLTEQDVLDEPTRGSWSYNQSIESKYQIYVAGSSYETNYPYSNFVYQNDDGTTTSLTGSAFSRGHQIPDADRKNTSDKNQTYLVTNQTPQIQNSFNSGIWSNLEKAARQFVVTDPSDQNNYNGEFTTTDVLYVVTGPCYQKVDGNETVYTLTGNDNTIVPYTVPIPNYYWQAFLKVKKNGNTITSAKAIGFWYPHKALKKEDYYDSKYVVSVRQIEAWTGFNLFHNLQDSIEETAETNSDWNTFKNF